MQRITIWGSRGSIPVSGAAFHRHGGATTCVEVELDSPTHPNTPKRLLIDCGTGLTELGKNWGDRSPEALLLQTHMHWDHIQGFPFFAPLFNPLAKFTSWSVPREGTNFHEALSQQMTRPTFPIGLDILPAQLNFEDLPREGSRQRGEVEVVWTEMLHPSGSTAYRINYRDTSIVISGDVEIQQGCGDALIKFAEGADLLIMDAQYTPDEYTTRQGFGHSTPVDAVEIARAAKCQHLLLTHHDPTHTDQALDQKLAIARNVAPRTLTVDNALDRMQMEIRPTQHSPSQGQGLTAHA